MLIMSLASLKSSLDLIYFCLFSSENSIGTTFDLASSICLKYFSFYCSSVRCSVFLWIRDFVSSGKVEYGSFPGPNSDLGLYTRGSHVSYYSMACASSF